MSLYRLIAAFVFISASLHSQSALEKRDAAQEELSIGIASKQDAAAIADAMGTPEHPGWYALALKTRDQRLGWWREARFGCFIHWGPYSVLGGEWNGKPNPGYAEHIMRVNKIPLAVYREQVAAKFHPDAFDAKTWVQQIKAAGMQYIILTAKHHDGFALWPSQASSYNIRDVSHFQRDPLRELVDAARAAGLHVGFYYSHAFDWEDADAPGNDWDYENPGGDRKLFGGENWYATHPELVRRAETYVDQKAIPQLQELIARYQPDILWFDTPGKLPFFLQAKIVKAVRQASPTVVINGRAARNGSINLGDYLNTADRPAEIRPTEGDWEAIPTTNESYGYNKLDGTHKPVSYFVQLLAKSAAKGGNILLNIGPRGDGRLDPRDVAILHGLGEWMNVNGESIHGTVRTVLPRQVWGETTLHGNEMYLHVFRWPTNGRLVLAGLSSPIASVQLLSTAQKFKFANSDSDSWISVGSYTSASPDTVIKVSLKRSATASSESTLLQNGFNAYELHAFDAELLGKGAIYGDGKTHRDYVQFNAAATATLQWHIRAEEARRYRVQALYSVDHEGENLQMKFGGEVYAATLPVSSAGNSRVIDLPSIQLGKAEEILEISAPKAHGSVRLFKLILIPATPSLH